MKLRSLSSAALALESKPSRRKLPTTRVMRALPRSLVAVSTVKPTAGLLLYRRSSAGGLEVLLAHLGGPFYATKDEGVWSLPKAGVNDDESLLAAAKRDFTAMLGAPAPTGHYRDLGFANQRSGAVIYAWAVEGEFDPSTLSSQRFALEWPPASGLQSSFPEVDRAAWFEIETARRKIAATQMPLLNRLITALS